MNSGSSTDVDSETDALIDELRESLLQNISGSSHLHDHKRNVIFPTQTMCIAQRER